MKFVAFILICVGFSNVSGDLCIGDYLKSMEEKCLAANGGDRVLIEDFLSMKKPTNDDAKCYMACMLEECNYMDASGNIKPNTNKDYMDSSGNIEPDTYKDYLKVLSHGDAIKEKLMASDFEQCQKTINVDGNKCTTAGNLIDCLVTNCKECEWDLHGI